LSRLHQSLPVPAEHLWQSATVVDPRHDLALGNSHVRSNFLPDRKIKGIEERVHSFLLKNA
ncbi:MAG: hypothetical protein Q8R82_02250, partial [Hyphomonadaceae bacterium]|nr:hypothetical protein [Hyphomonadaceae bacterium]